GEEQPQPECRQCRRGRRTENDREQHGKSKPYTGVYNGYRQHHEGPRDLLAARRKTEHEQAEADDEQPQREEADRHGGKPGQEFSEQQRVAIDRLRQDAAERAPAVLAVDEVEAEPDRDERHQERQQRRERQRDRLARLGEQPQEQERI